MTPSELANVFEYCEDRWPATRNFRHAEKATYDFIAIPAEAVWEAARNHYNSGEKTAPTLSELRAEAARIAGQRGLLDPEATNCDTRGSHSRARAITERDDGKREAQCLDCGATIIREAHLLLTVGEQEERDKLGAPSASDPLTDKIAP